MTAATLAHIRWMIRRDMPGVLAVSAAGPDPLTEPAVLACLRQRNRIGHVATGRGDEVIGFMLYELHRTHIRLLHLGVHPRARRQGVGRALVARLQHKVVTHQRERVEATVGERWAAAIGLLAATGFRAAGVAWGWADDGDGIDMDWHA